MTTEERTFPSDLASLSSIIDWIDKTLKATPFSSSQKKQIELAIEEAIVNVISYAQVKNFQLKCTLHSDRVEFFLIDEGPPFNPLKHAPDVNTDLPLEKRSEGGLGIHFILKCMDKVDYQFDNGRNVLKLVRFFPN